MTRPHLKKTIEHVQQPIRIFSCLFCCKLKSGGQSSLYTSSFNQIQRIGHTTYQPWWTHNTTGLAYDKSSDEVWTFFAHNYRCSCQCFASQGNEKPNLTVFNTQAPLLTIHFMNLFINGIHNIKDSVLHAIKTNNLLLNFMLGLWCYILIFSKNRFLKV